MATREGNTLIKAAAVNLTLGGNKILENLDLEIRDIIEPGRVRGQVRCLLGPSGIGKTQFLRLLAGLQQPDSGAVLVSLDGQALVPVKAGMVGVVAQDYPLFQHLTVLENLILAAKQSGVSAKEASDKSRELLARFDLGPWEQFWPGNLSGGQRQRIAILQQVIAGRLFLILDEPFSGLDPRAIQSVINLIAELAAGHELHTSLIITHDIRAAIRTAERIYVMGRTFDDKGKLLRAAHIVKTIDLLEKNIAWRDDIKSLPDFNKLVNETEDIFERI